MSTVSSWCITCKCGHTAPIEEFTTTALGVALPLRSYQCRACNEAWEIKQVDPAWVARSGNFMPATYACLPTPGQRSL